VPGDQASVSGLGREVGGPDGTKLDDLMEIGVSQPSSAAGTPLLDSRGAVIGITVAFGPAGRSVSYAMPIDLAHEVEQQLLKGGHVVPVWLGIEGSDLAPDKAKALGVAGGAVVSKVAPDGPAQMAGLRAGDIVVGLDGRVVASMANLIMAVHARPPMTQVELAVLRGGDTETFTARLAPRPRNS
jgi:S1-C subfamily serine protease